MSHLQEYESLCANGEQFPDRQVASLDGLTFDHPKDGPIAITIDREALAAQGNIYVGSPVLRKALQDRHIGADSLAGAEQVLSSHLAASELVWGFSGYATAGYNYDVEAQGLDRVYTHLAKRSRTPGLAVDGGVSSGSLGLSGVIAKEHNVPTMGMLPLQGLAAAGIRDHLVVWGNTYRDREVLVGTTPDVLVCVAGAEGTQRECQVALRWGSAVLLLALREEYAPSALPNTYQLFPEMTEAIDSGSMVVCRSMEDIPDGLDAMLVASEESDRLGRLSALGQLLYD